jgi:hypothetical protein
MEDRFGQTTTANHCVQRNRTIGALESAMHLLTQMRPQPHDLQ